jgi:hypothetical protein
LIVAEELLLRAAAVGRLTEKLELAVALGTIDDPFAVWRPLRIVVVNRAKSEAGAGAARRERRTMCELAVQIEHSG